MNEKQAYLTMFYFLKQLYERTKSDEIGGLLGDLSLLEDGSPMDPAMAHDWNEAVEFINNNPDTDIALLKLTPYKS